MRQKIKATLLDNTSKQILRDQRSVGVLLHLQRSSNGFDKYYDAIESIENGLLNIDVGYEPDVDIEDMYISRNHSVAVAE